jgi:hypothetical protein
MLKFSAGKYKNIREFSKVPLDSNKVGPRVKKEPAISNDVVNDHKSTY